MQHKYRHSNDLILWRQRMGYTQTQVALILGRKDTTWLSNLELGKRIPALHTALELAIIYRVPVDFLYRDLYSALRDKIRKREQQLPLKQGELFGGADD